jgi:RimJ/RimL family protein N-acetyltransferase
MVHLRSADERAFDWLAGSASLADAPVLCPGGLAPPEVMLIVADMAARVRAGFAGESAWFVIADDEAVGLISYKQPPENGSADIGYGIGASREGRGHATGAVRALAVHARAAGLSALTAETSIDNPASQRVLENAGFRRTGERDDEEDGRLICWSLDLAAGECE